MAVVLNPEIKEQMDLACYHLLRGDPVALPTETVYGLAAPISHLQGLAKIFKLKNRPEFDPLIVHVAKDFDSSQLIQKKLSLHEKLMREFWPGPLTLLFERSASVPDLCTAGTEYVALRSPAHPVFQKILSQVGPLAAPSANRFGRVSPTRALDVIEELGPYGLEAVVEGGACSVGLESTVVKIYSESKIEILRQGAVSLERLQSFLGTQVEVIVSKRGSGMEESRLESPGQLLSHYAPRTPLRILSAEEVKSLSAALLEDGTSRKKALLVTDLKSVQLPNDLKPNALTEIGSDLEAASSLFSTLRNLDRQGYEEILVVLGPERDLFRAINERLRKASHHS